MPNLINTDNAGNVFYNYITPVVKGEALDPGSTQFDTTFSAYLTTKLGSENGNWYSGATYGSNVYAVRLPAPGFESLTSNVNYFYDSDARLHFAVNGMLAAVNARNSTNSSTFMVGNTSQGGSIGTFATNSNYVNFCVMNDFAMVFASFTSGALTTLSKFFYLGFCREPSFTGTTTAPRGAVAIVSQPTQSILARRPTAENSTTATTLSTAADAITSPPIVCTAGTDPGDGSETATDIVIRDAAAPYNPVGKLWNCIDLPATCNVGDLVKNTGAHDGDASTSEQDVYLCVMPWGTRKLGMRVWTEGVT